MALILGVDHPPLVAHVVYRFATGGIENGLVNLINHMSPDRYRHAVIALTDVTDFSRRIKRDDVLYFSLNKAPGHGLWQYPNLFKLFRQLRPAIVHSRNLAALEAQVPAWAAGVPVRIHGEHGRDMADLTGHHVGFQRMRCFYKKFVNHFTTLSPDLSDYLVQKIHVSPDLITHTCNGVDTAIFYPSAEGVKSINDCPFDPSQHWLVGTVGRMQPVKDQVMLAQAFVHALTLDPSLQLRIRLVMVGNGPLRLQAQSVLDSAGLSHLAWFPGERDDVADIMRGLHVFALPSLAEGICNTLLEAMASGLPVIATAVGGNAHLVVPDVTGYLVEPGNVQAMAYQLVNIFKHPQRAKKMGLAGRQRVLDKFSMHTMVCAYESVYDQSLLRVSASRLAH